MYLNGRLCLADSFARNDLLEEEEEEEEEKKNKKREKERKRQRNDSPDS